MADERYKLSVVRRLRAQGLSEEQIQEHLAKLDQEQEDRSLDESSKKRGLQIFTELDRARIVGPDGQPL